MKRLLFVLGFVLFQAPLMAGEWRRVDGVTGQVSVVSAGAGMIAAATGEGDIFIGTDTIGWERVFISSGSINGVTMMGVKLYAASQDGVWHSEDHGRKWERLFSGESFSIQNIDGKVVAATPRGVFESRDNGGWRRKAHAPVSGRYLLAVSEKELFAVSGEGIFRLKGSVWKRELYPPAREEDPDSDAETTEDPEVVPVPCALAQKDGSVFACGMGTRIYERSGPNADWRVFPELPSVSGVSALCYKNDALIASTAGRIYIFQGDIWQHIPFSGTAIRSLACSGAHIMAGGENGLFILDGGVDCREMPEKRDWPSVRQVQEAAIVYAEVHPDKIRQWRMAASRKSWLPQVSVDFDRDCADLWHWETGSTTKTDDDTLRRGRESLDWGIHLSWDFGDIIWNGEQTSIDVRSRLMVELRRDILDEVTRLYFERLRILSELEGTAGDTKKRREKELRVIELQALLDAMTGGYFSRCLDPASGGAEPQKQLAIRR